MKIEIEITEEMVGDALAELAHSLVKKVVTDRLADWKVDSRIKMIFSECFDAKIKAAIEDELQTRSPEKLKEKIGGMVDAGLNRRIAARIARDEKKAAPVQLNIGEKS